MKIRILGMICACFVLLTGCGNKTADKAIEQGKLAIANIQEQCRMKIVEEDITAELAQEEKGLQKFIM